MILLFSFVTQPPVSRLLYRSNSINRNFTQTFSILPTCPVITCNQYIGAGDSVAMSSMTHPQHGNRRLHFSCAVHSRHPFPPIGDAAYRQHPGEGPSHGHRQNAPKIGKDRACGSGDILADRQIDTQTDILITILRNSCLRAK